MKNAGTLRQMSFCVIQSPSKMHIPHHTTPVIPLQNRPLWCRVSAV